MEITDFAVKFITNPVAAFTLGLFVMYCLLLWMDSIARKKLGRQHRDGIQDTDAKGKVTVAYPPGFKFLLEEEPEHDPATMEEEVKSLVRLYESREISIYSILHRLLDYSKRISEYESDSENTKEELNRKVSELQEMSGNLTATKDEHEETIRDLKNKLEEAGRELKAAQQSHEDFVKKQNLAKEEIEEKLQELRQEKAELTQQNTDHSREIEELLSEKKGLQEQIDAEQIKCAELEKHVETFRNKVTETAGELEKARSSQDEMIEDLKQRTEDLEDENRSLKARLDKAPQEEEIQELENEKEQLTARIDEYEKQAEKTGEEKQKLAARIDEYEKQQEKTDKEKQKLAARIDEYEKQQEKTDEEKKEMLAKLETYKRQHSELAQNIERYREQDTITDGKSVLAEETPVAKALYKENKDLTRKAEEYLETIDRLKVELAELETLQTENMRLKNEFDKKVEKKTDPLLEQIKDLEQQIAASEGSGISGSQEMLELEQALAERDSEIERLNDILEKTEEESARLNSILEKKTEALKKIESQKKKLTRDITSMLEYDDTESRELVLSDIDLLSEISEPGLPKTEDIPNIVNVEVGEEVQEGQKESATKATEDYSSKTGSKSAEKLYNVFLPKLTNEDKKEKAVPLLEEISGISRKEAKKLVNKIVIPVIKGIERDKADEIKDRFKEAGIFPRIKRQL